MRFTTAWAQIASQNVVLKTTIALLTLCVIFLTISTVQLSARDPLIVERSCFSKAVEKVPAKHTKSEIEAFLSQSIAMRFNTGSNLIPGFMSLREEEIRKEEQRELNHRKMTQKVVFNAITEINKDTILVDVDRLISIGSIRSALPFPLEIEMARVSRNTSNPYGLKIMSIKQKKDLGK